MGDLERTEIGEDGLFNGDYVRHIKSASNVLLNDMCKTCGVQDSYNIFPNVLNKSTTTKAQLAEWLYSAIFLLDRCSIPLMDIATDQKAELDGLKDDKISDQKKIIQLQGELIDKKNEELGSVKDTVETELKSYSSVLKESCSAALTPQKIASAVKQVNAQEDRSKNVIIFGLPEGQTENVESKVSEILNLLEEKPKVIDCRGIGHDHPGKPRPIRFKVRNSDIVYQILRKAKRLKDIEGYKTVFISPDRSPEERINRQALVGEIKRQNDTTHRYFIRKGEIVSVKLD